ncbi:MAG: hypothetical protein WAU56_10155, partial [Steroidobacteraceae bacterium]
PSAGQTTLRVEPMKEELRSRKEPESLINIGRRSLIKVGCTLTVLDGGACVHLHGKGRKQRAAPLWKTTVTELRRWLRLNPSLQAQSALLPNRDGHPMTRSNVEKRLDLAVARATPQ